MGIFKAYDVRGVYPTEINAKIMHDIGRSFADFILGSRISVGYDMRLSSKELSKAFTAGVLEQGKDVINFGLSSTPMAYFAANHLKTDGTAMITASHNPKEYNGVKFTREEAIPISGDTGITTIEKNVVKGKFKSVDTKGKLSVVDIRKEYGNHISSFIKKISAMKVVIDASNGMGAQDYNLLSLPVEPVKIHFDINGNFPGHDPNPMKKGACEDILIAVKKEKADLGIIFDGDADRVFFISENGEVIPSDYIAALIAEEMLKTGTSSILYDLRSSWIVPETIHTFGGTPIMCKVGHSFIKEAMRKEHSLFAGELSGHFYFKDNYYCDSGIITAIYVMNLLCSKKKKMTELIAPLKKYFATGEINSDVEDKDTKIKDLAQKYNQGKISYLDGIRIDFDDWWFNVRPSNTEPLLRLNLEAKSKELMEEKKEDILKLIRA